MEYRDRNALDNDLVRFKMTQARDSLEQAKALLQARMDLDLIANGVFYAMFYAVLALLQKRKVPSSSQDATISLFDREFVRTGVFDWRFSEAIRRAFEFRTTCSCEDRKAATLKDIEESLPIAEEFVGKVEAIINTI